MFDFRKNPEKGKISRGITSYGYDVTAGYVFLVYSPVNATVVDPKNFDPKCLVPVDLTPVVCDWIRRFETMRDPIYYDCKNCHRRLLDGTVTKEETERPCPGVQQPPNHILIPPHSFALAMSVETFNIRRDVLAVIVGKSTYARCGIIVNCTPLEPEWRGKITIEISNTTPLPAKIYVGEGIMQVLFFKSDDIEAAHYVHFLNHLMAEHGQSNRVMDNIRELAQEGSCEVSYADKKGKYQDQTGITTPKVKS